MDSIIRFQEELNTVQIDWYAKPLSQADIVQLGINDTDWRKQTQRIVDADGQWYTLIDLVSHDEPMPPGTVVITISQKIGKYAKVRELIHAKIVKVLK